MKRNLSNFLIVFLNIIPLLTSFFLLEYKISKYLHPQGLWVATSGIFDVIIAVFMAIFSMLSLTTILLSYFKKMEKPVLMLSNDKFIDLTGLIKVLTAINWLLIGIIILILKNNIDFVLFPWVRLR